MIVTGSLDEMKADTSGSRWCLKTSWTAGRWPEGVESVHQEGRVVSILASHNADAIVEQAQSIPGATVERFPVTLKEIFLEHVRSN